MMDYSRYVPGMYIIRFPLSGRGLGELGSHGWCACLIQRDFHHLHTIPWRHVKQKKENEVLPTPFLTYLHIFFFKFHFNFCRSNDSGLVTISRSLGFHSATQDIAYIELGSLKTSLVVAP